MGALTLPIGHHVYVDANILIYSVEQVGAYWPLLESLWAASNAHSIQVVTSELSILEALTGPLKRGDAALVAGYERVLFSGEIELVPIDRDLLRNAARLRASTRLRIPDAIHAATSVAFGCSMFLTNDGAFRSVAELRTVVLQDILGS